MYGNDLMLHSAVPRTRTRLAPFTVPIRLAPSLPYRTRTMSASAAASAPASTPESLPAKVNFALSDVAKHASPLGDGKYIKTAGCLIIGDEVLNGKVRRRRSRGRLRRWPTPGCDGSRDSTDQGQQQQLFRKAML